MVAGAVAGIASALADTPLSPPQTYTVCSATKAFCATSDATADVTLVRDASGADLWRVAGWHRSIFVSDDGRYVAIGYPGLNLASTSITLSDAMVTFHDRAGVAGRVRLFQLYRDVSRMKRTASHYLWGSVVGFRRGNVLEIALADGRRLRFKPRR